MHFLLNKIKGDKIIWLIVILLSVPCSFNQVHLFFENFSDCSLYRSSITSINTFFRDKPK